jgi:phosphate transport system permease protein
MQQKKIATPLFLLSLLPNFLARSIKQNKLSKPDSEKKNHPIFVQHSQKRDVFLGSIQIRDVLLLFAMVSIVVVSFIFVFIFIEGFPAFQQVGFSDLVFGIDWRPTGAGFENPIFGTFTLTYGSLIVTFASLLLSVPLGVMCAVYIGEIADPRIRDILKTTVELLAGIPSVVYGFFGVVVVIPTIKAFFDVPAGETALAGAMVLAVMVLPTIVSVSEDAITAVPREFREASLALGATKWQTIQKVVVPAASSGIAAAIILGFGRAIGETMAVLMLVGGTPLLPEPFYNLLSPVRTMTGTIAAEMGEAPFGSLHYHVLFSIAVILFVITFVSNLVARHLFVTEELR